MKFIQKVTIKYFRSLHTVDVKKCSSVNVISGRNDVGKSNIIKALNLFFNGQADWESEYDFYENFSKKRLEEVRQESIKGKQFISIKIEFARPTNYKGSLPEVFSVERKWLRDSRTYEQSNNLASLGNAGKLPSSLTAAQRSLATFLNKLHFEYIPAIRDRGYVNELLGRLQRSLLDVTINQNHALLETANTLAAHIEGQIGDLKNDFETATKIETSITPPSKISSLFQSFLVSTATDDGSVPLKFRGDGLQSRYIASVLHYIAINSSDFYIWGYEEPEIALEYNHASQMAKDFYGKYSNTAQIFLSTHSPAFIALEGEQVSCYRVSQINSVSVVANVALSSDLSDKEKLKEELGVIEIQKDVHKYYSTKLADLASFEAQILKLESEVNESQKPLIVTEGKTDKSILEAAAKSILQDSGSIAIRACDNTGRDGGSGGAGQLGRLIESIHPDDSRLVIAIFDNDEEGKKEFDKLSRNFVSSDLGRYVKKHKNGFAWAMLLPEPDFRLEYMQAGNLCIEYMFSDEILNRTFNNGSKLKLKPVQPILMVGNRKQDMRPSEISQFIDKAKLKAFQKIGEGKERFSTDVVPLLSREDFSAFEELFDTIGKICQQ